MGCGQFITHLHSFLFTLFPCSSVGSLPQDTVLHYLLQCESFPQAVVLYQVLQHGFPTGSQVLPAPCSHVGSPQSHNPLWASLWWCGVHHGLQVDLCSSMCCGALPHQTNGTWSVPQITRSQEDGPPHVTWKLSLKSCS